MKRKDFVKSLTLGAIATGALTSCKLEKAEQGPEVNINFNKSYSWKMVTTWPPNFPVLGEGCQRFADAVNKLSGGRIKITVYGGGELVPPLEVFEAVNSGAAEFGGGSPYYWAGKNSAFQFFSGVPFGMNPQQTTAWMTVGGGYDIWKSLYATYNLIPFMAGNTGVQMGGWFNKELNQVSDFRGLKMRMPGIGGKVLNKLDATTVLVAGSEIYTSLERGVIDATEWIGPYHDYLMGFHKIAKYYYAPGWHEPGTQLEFMMTKRVYDKLPADLREIIFYASQEVSQWTLSAVEAKNYEYLLKIKEESDVEIRRFSPDIMEALREKTEEVLTDIVEANPAAEEVYSSYKKFQSNIQSWSEYSEKLYYSLISSS